VWSGECSALVQRCAGLTVQAFCKDRSPHWPHVNTATMSCRGLPWLVPVLYLCKNAGCTRSLPRTAAWASQPLGDGPPLHTTKEQQGGRYLAA